MEERLCEHRDRDGRRQLYRYNMYGSPTLHENPAERMRESWEYDAMGRLITATGGGMQYRYTYYDNGRLKEKQASGRTLLAYAYDLSGNVVSRRDLTGKETCYGYDRCGRLKSVTDNGRVLAAYTYHGDGRVESRTIADTIRTDFRYDADKNLTHMKTVDMTAQGRKLVWEEYPAYDHNGNMVEKRNLEGTTRYAYDVNNQLVEVSYPGAGGLLSERFGYDKAGNRLTRERRTVDSIIMETYRHDNCNRIKELNRRTYEPDGVAPKLKKSPAVSNNPDAVASYIGETSYYGYDRSGNLLSDGNATYSYDGFGRTAEVKMANGNSQINRYDAEGLRAEMEENGQLVKFLFNEEKEVIAEQTDDGVIRYIRGLGIISSDSESARTYYHYVSDNQGSVRLILTDTANDRRIRNYYCYDAFGESVISHEDVHNRFRFNGEQYDPMTSQYYLRARFYNPVIGRFTQEDTYYGDGLNLYEYCRNNPVIYRDPSGHDICPAQIALYRQYMGSGMSPQQAWNQMCLDLYGDGTKFNPSIWIDGNSYDITKLRKTQPYVYPENVSAIYDFIAQNGPNSIPPIPVRVYNGQVLIVDGHHRLEAFYMLGYDRVPIKYLHSSQLGKIYPDGTYYRSLDELLSAERLCN